MQGRSTKSLTAALAAFAAACCLAAGAVAADRLDPSFGRGGYAVGAEPEGAAIRLVGVQDLAEAPGGDLAAALSSYSRYGYFGAARFHADGTLDPTFGRGGFTEKLEVAPPNDLTETLPVATGGVAVQPDGKVLVAGFLQELSKLRGRPRRSPVVARYLRDGALDPTFAGDGVFAPGFYAQEDVAYDIAVAPSGRILTVGSRGEHDRSYKYAVVTAYTPAGDLDRGFGASGQVVIASASFGGTTHFSAVKVLPDGKILLAGYRNDRLLLARLRPNGKSDRSFGGGDGRALVDLGWRGGYVGSWSASVAVQADGRVVVQAARVGNRAESALVRFDPDGDLDRSFGREGLVTPLRGMPYGKAMALDREGCAVVVGADGFAAARYLPDGRPDPGFGSGGVSRIALGDGAGAVTALSQPDGSVVAGGWLAMKDGEAIRSSLLLGRYLPGG